MSREQNYTAIILKKQPFNEADEIITFYTKEIGKVRGWAKSIKLQKSKLQHALQSLFLVNVRLAEGKGLKKIIGAEAKETFAQLRRGLNLVSYAFFALESVLKFTPDEEPNERLFLSLYRFLCFINSHEQHLDLALIKFKIDLLSATGFSAVFHESFAQQKDKLLMLLEIESTDYKGLSGFKPRDKTAAIQDDLSRFIAHHLEREVKSEKYISNMI